jgi:hypothetical protein
MTDQPIQYAAAPPQHAMHSRRGMIAFGCACASACGVALTIFLIRQPLGGPVGGLIRGMAPIFGAAVLLLWIGGIVLGISALRQQHRLRSFGFASLTMCGVAAVIFGLMLLLQY